jgi:hypothetical protein
MIGRLRRWVDNLIGKLGLFVEERHDEMFGGVSPESIPNEAIEFFSKEVDGYLVQRTTQLDYLCVDIDAYTHARIFILGGEYTWEIHSNEERSGDTRSSTDGVCLTSVDYGPSAEAVALIRLLRGNK